MRPIIKQVATLTTLLLIAPVFAQSRRSSPAQRTQPRPAAQATHAQPATQRLPLHRVILYSNGVAYFERRGTVQGKAEINLPFKQSQIDDVLKSLVVLDLGKGKIGAVSYNSSAPASARLSDIPFSIEPGTDEDGGLAGVLKQLQGARVAVSSDSRSASGAILTVEERKSQIDANKPPLVTRSLVVSSASGELTSFDLANIRSVTLLDEGARHDVTEFANASAAARRRDAKTITVTSDGEGSRELVVSYTIAAPIWKTSYRVVMDGSGQPFFQGWAIVDNVSEEDWTDVKLSLVSGSPVSFIQPLQQPMYRYRPIIPVPSDVKLGPQVYTADEGSVGNFGGVGGSVVGGVPGGVVGGGDRLARGGATINKQVQDLPLQGRSSNQLQLSSAVVNETSAGVGEPTRSMSDLISGTDSGVETAASGSEVGDLFEYNVDQPVTVPRDRSALIPIVQTRLEGARVSLYNEGGRKDRPMSGIRLKNISNLTLEGGPLTVIDGDAYAGEALMERLKPGEERFISFAVDLGTMVSVKDKTDQQPAFFVRVQNGTFQAHFHQSNKKVYTVTNQTDRPRIVFVEHPIRQGWALSDDTPKPYSKTPSVYRFRIEVAARKTVELNVTEQQALMDTYALSTITPREIEVFASKHYIDDTARAALTRITELKNQIAEVEAKLESLDKESSDIGEDQSRLRENIKALKDTSETRQLISRYVAKASEQETRMEQITSEKKLAAAELQKLQKELRDAIRNLSLDRKLTAQS